MKLSTIITAAILTLGSLATYGQVVASIDRPVHFTQPSTLSISQFSYTVVDSETNVAFESIDYSASSQKLAMTTVQAVQFVSIVKDGESFLENMPVFSNNLNMSMANYSAGNYELHLTVEGKIVPTVIQVVKS